MEILYRIAFILLLIVAFVPAVPLWILGGSKLVDAIGYDKFLDKTGIRKAGNWLIDRID